jgi:heterodisulfide reductase subunit B
VTDVALTARCAGRPAQAVWRGFKTELRVNAERDLLDFAVEVARKLTRKLFDMVAEAGAEMIVTACPMCQSSLDLRQKDAEKAAGQRLNMPVLYITQLLGLCLGLSPKELGFDRLMVPPTAVLEAVGTIKVSPARV